MNMNLINAYYDLGLHIFHQCMVKNHRHIAHLIELSFPLNISAVKEDKRLEEYITSFSDIAKTLTPIEHQRLSSPCSGPLKHSEKKNDKGMSSSEPSSQKNEDTLPYAENCEFHELTPTVIRSSSSSQMIASEDLKVSCYC